MYKTLISKCIGAGKAEITYLMFPEKRVWIFPGVLGDLHICPQTQQIFIWALENPPKLKMPRDPKISSYTEPKTLS